MSDQQLMNTFKFTEADLQANRNGQLTQKQQADLAEDSKYNKIFGAIGGIFLFGLAAVGLFFGAAGVVQSHDTQSKLTAILLIIVWVGIFGVLGLRTLLHAFSKFQINIVKAEGPVNIVKVERSTTRSDGTASHYFAYEMHIGEGTFDVGSDAAGFMMQGDVYAIYYTQGSEKEILSVEFISKGN